MKALATCLLALGVAFATPVAGASLPQTGGVVALTARDQPLPDFLRQLFAQSGVRVVVDPRVTGLVSGEFHKSAAQTFAQIAGAFHLISYFDGEAVYVEPASAAITRDVPLRGRDPSDLIAELRRKASPDGENRLYVQDGRLVARGARRFVQRVAELARPSQAEPLVAAGGLAPAPVSTLEYRVYYLRYAWAGDQVLRSGSEAVTVPGLATVLRRLVADGAGGADISRARIPAVRRLGGAGLAGTQAIPAPLSVAALAASAAHQPIEEPARVTVADTVEQGPRVEADPRLNAIIIRDTTERLDAYEPLIRALDVEPQLIEIEAQIIDIDVQRAKQFGVSLDFTDASGRTRFSSNPAPPLTQPGSPGLVSAVIDVGGDLSVRMRALETDGAATITSRPLVLTLSDVEAVFGDSQTFFVRVAGSLNVDLFNVTSGTTLRVTPHVLKDGGATRIRMLVAIQDGALQDTMVDNIPIVDNAELNTQALIQEGQSLLIGGMVVRSNKRSHGKVPLLGDLPIAGALFRTTDNATTRTERLFLITPRLISPGQMVPAPNPPDPQPGSRGGEGAP